MVGWIAPALAILKSDESPLQDGKLTYEQVSWLGSISCFGAICGVATFSYFTSFIGCKRSILFLSLPSILFWSLIHFGNSYQYILIARFFSGYSGGAIQTTIVLYISEISNNE